MIATAASTIVTSHRFVRYILRDAPRHAASRVPVQPGQLAPATRAILQASLVALAEHAGLQPTGEEPSYLAEPFRHGVLVIASLPMERAP